MARQMCALIYRLGCESPVCRRGRDQSNQPFTAIPDLGFSVYCFAHTHQFQQIECMGKMNAFPAEAHVLVSLRMKETFSSSTTLK